MKTTARHRDGSPRLKESSLNSSERAPDILSDIYELPAIICLNIHRFDGEFHGEAAASFQGGHEYKGMFSKGQMDGPGTFRQADGVKYEGDFVCNVPMGQGTFTWPDGSSYTGDVCRGSRHGLGIYKCAQHGVTYTGQWRQGKRHGQGTVYVNEGKTSWYKGDWLMNKIEGWGERCYLSGNIYTGEWRNNLRHGEGTMNWITLGQRYVGNWQNGVQHGLGTHIWLLKRVDGSQYAQSNQYKGDFFEGRRHGKGTFYYAGGAKYTGEWRNDKKHGKGKLTAKSGQIFECEFDDGLMINSFNKNRAPTPLGVALLSESGLSALEPDQALNILGLLDKIPSRDRETERKQVEFVLLSHRVELRLIYGFYSRLGRSHPPDNIFLLSRLQFWRLLKDCNIHRHGVTLTQMDRFLREETGSAETHFPFKYMQLHEFLMALVTVAYYIYREDSASTKPLLAACLSRLMRENVLPNARNVKGFLFGEAELTAEALKYANRSWEVFDSFCVIYSANRDDKSMTCRQLLWMFKHLRLFDQQLTTTRLLELITAENRDYNSQSSRVELEIVFLEFFEVLLGCAELKSPQVPDAPKRLQIGSHSHAEEAQGGTGVMPDVGSQEIENQDLHKPQLTESYRDQRNVDKVGVDTTDHQVQSRILTVQQFFKQCFFPAVDIHWSVTSKVETLNQEDQTDEAHHSSGRVLPPI